MPTSFDTTNARAVDDSPTSKKQISWDATDRIPY